MTGRLRASWNGVRKRSPQISIDNGAPAWPGDIDLAPDAIYRQVAGEREFVSAPLETDVGALTTYRDVNAVEELNIGER